MTNYRIRKSPSGQWYQLQYQKQTLKSFIVRLFLPDYPRQWKWVYTESRASSEQYIRNRIKELQQQELDRVEEKWGIIDA